MVSIGLPSQNENLEGQISDGNRQTNAHTTIKRSGRVRNWYLQTQSQFTGWKWEHAMAVC